MLGPKNKKNDGNDENCLNKSFSFSKKAFLSGLLSACILIIGLVPLILYFFNRSINIIPLDAYSKLEFIRNSYHTQLQPFNQGMINDEVELLLQSRPNPHRTLVGMISVYRATDEYLYRTLSSVLPSLFSNNLTSSTHGSITLSKLYVKNDMLLNRLYLFLGSPVRNYTKFLNYNPLVSIIPMEEQFWIDPFSVPNSDDGSIPLFPHASSQKTKFKDLHVSIRAAHNYIRMIEGLVQISLTEQQSHARNSSSKKVSSFAYGILLLEDDVLLLPDGSSRLDATIEAIEKTIGPDSDFILSCYLVEWLSNSIGNAPSNHKSVTSEFPPGESSNILLPSLNADEFSRFQFTAPDGWCCTQCIYMPLKTAQKASTWIRDEYLSEERKRPFLPYDHQLADFSLEFEIPIFGMHDPIAQHIGKSTTGLGAFHQGVGRLQVTF